jgi:hypothetical protein
MEARDKTQIDAALSARRKAIFVFRDRYELKIHPYKRFIQNKALDSGQNIHQAAIALVNYVKDHDDDGTAQMLIYAALAELISPPD